MESALALAVSLITLVYTIIGLRKKAKKDQLELVEREVVQINEKLKKCEDERKGLLEENAKLVRSVVSSVIDRRRGTDDSASTVRS